MVVKSSSKILVLDIEGTTTSICFVKDVLFSYVKKNLEKYVNDNLNSKEFLDTVELLREDALNEKKNNNSQIPLIIKDVDTNCINEEIKQSIIENVNWQMSIDRKSKSLKQLQGLIWRKGYQDGDLIGHIYPDVKSAFEAWTKLNKKIFIYSSGSIEAQKLLFANTYEGNLLNYISGHFDTNIGSKLESSSYKKIVNKLNTASKDVLFLTDLLKEAKAARQAGLNVVLVIRPGNISIDAQDLSTFETITSFNQLEFIS